MPSSELWSALFVSPSVPTGLSSIFALPPCASLQQIGLGCSSQHGHALQGQPGGSLPPELAATGGLLPFLKLCQGDGYVHPSSPPAPFFCANRDGLFHHNTIQPGGTGGAPYINVI